MIALVLAMLMAGQTVPFRAVCNSPDPLARMSTVQQTQGMEAGNPLWAEAIAAGVCLYLPVSVSGVLIDRLGSWKGQHEGAVYKWSLWSLDYKGVTLYGLFPDEDGPSA